MAVVGVPLIVAVVVLVLAGGVLFLVRTRGGHPVDRMQRHLRAGNNLAPVLYPRGRKDAQQLHPNAVDLPPWQKIGTLVGTGSAWAWQGWRDVAIYIFEPGRGKTTGSLVRHVLEAPGPAVMTSNKVDGESCSGSMSHRRRTSRPSSACPKTRARSRHGGCSTGTTTLGSSSTRSGDRSAPATKPDISPTTTNSRCRSWWIYRPTMHR